MLSAALKACFFLLFLGCFVAQVLDSFVKYLEGKTTVARSTEPMKNMELPYVTICPGYEPGVSPVTGQAYPSVYDDNITESGATAEEMMEWWEVSTYSLEEVLMYMFIGDWQNPREILSDDGVNATAAREYYAIRAVDAEDGRCYSVHVTVALNQGEFLFFRFRDNYTGKPSIFIHHDEGSLVGLYDYKFPLDVITLGVLENGGERRIYLEKEIHHVMEATTNCSYEETTDTFLGCSKNHLLSRYMENERVSLLAGNSSQTLLEPCENATEAGAMSNSVFNLAEEMLQLHYSGCVKPCIQYKYSTRVIDSERQASSRDIYVAYPTTNEILYDEYLLFDNGDIVAAVGGSLGLFLGFSCLDCSNRILDGLIRLCCGSKNKKESPPRWGTKRVAIAKE